MVGPQQRERSYSWVYLLQHYLLVNIPVPLHSTWTKAYVLCYKELLSVVVEEQKTLMKKHGENVDHDVLSEMDVVHSVTTLEGKVYDIPKGHIVAISLAFANRLPNTYKDPDNYDPNRLGLERDEDKLVGQFSYITFGGGRPWRAFCLFANKGYMEPSAECYGGW